METPRSNAAGQVGQVERVGLPPREIVEIEIDRIDHAAPAARNTPITGRVISGDARASRLSRPASLDVFVSRSDGIVTRRTAVIRNPIKKARTARMT